MLQSKRQVPDAQHTRDMFVVHEQGQAGDPAVPTRSPGGPCTKASSAQSWHLSGRGWHQQGPQGREGAGQTSWGWKRRAPWCPHAARPPPSWSMGKPAVFLQGGRVGSIFPKEKEAVDGGEWGEVPPRACNTDSPFWGTERGCTTPAPPAGASAWASLHTAQQQQRQDSCPARLQACPGKGKMPPKGLDGLNYHYLTRELKRGLWLLRPARALSSLITGRSLMQFHRIGKREKASDGKLLASGSASPDVQARGPGRAPPPPPPPQDRRVLPRAPQSPAGTALPPPGPDARLSLCCVLCPMLQTPASVSQHLGEGSAGATGTEGSLPASPGCATGQPWRSPGAQKRGPGAHAEAQRELEARQAGPVLRKGCRPALNSSAFG